MKYIPFINPSLPRRGKTMERENHHLVTMGMLRNHVPSSFSAIFLQRLKPLGLLQFQRFLIVCRRKIEAVANRQRIIWSYDTANFFKQNRRGDKLQTRRAAQWFVGSEDPGYPVKTRNSATKEKLSKFTRGSCSCWDSILKLNVLFTLKISN